MERRGNISERGRTAACGGGGGGAARQCGVGGGPGQDCDGLVESRRWGSLCPVLLHGGRAVCESLLIVEYVDEAFFASHSHSHDDAAARTTILSADPYARATARFWAGFVATKCLEPMWLSMWTDGGEARARLVAETKAGLAALEAELRGRGTCFFDGGDLGFVHLAACTLAHWLGVLEEVAGVRLVAEGEYQALCRWAQEYTSHEVVRRSLPDRDQLVAFFAANQERYRAMVNAARRGDAVGSCLAVAAAFDVPALRASTLCSAALPSLTSGA